MFGGGEGGEGLRQNLVACDKLAREGGASLLAHFHSQSHWSIRDWDGREIN